MFISCEAINTLVMIYGVCALLSITLAALSFLLLVFDVDIVYTGKYFFPYKVTYQNPFKNKT